MPYVPKWDLFAYVCSSEASADELIGAATAMPNSNGVLLVLRHDIKIAKRIGSAYLNMMVRFNDRMNKYKKRNMEMMMFLYADPEIGRNANAIKLDNKKFILFSDSKTMLNGFAKANRIRKLQAVKVIPEFESDYSMQ